ncbi:MAG: chemotaxis response regulator protein-glutamate methylesterase [Alphaproteobacteria bacterium]|nr:chemotaxis response regulator protein-glutamate methylesterase [Alphaproteobacteria bacterium]
MPKDKIKILIVDDSLSIRLVLKGIFSDQPDMEVVGTAADPLQAIEVLKEVQPDVMTLDIEMPNMDGLTFLKKLKNLRPIPVVVISTLTHKGSKTAMEALSLGAIDAVGKPSAKAKELERCVDEIVEKVKAAAFSRVEGAKPRQELQKMLKEEGQIKETQSTDSVLQKKAKAPAERPPLIAIGSSTGGPQALQEILTNLPSTDLPGIVVVQHIAQGFSASFANRLDGLCDLTVKEAHDTLRIKPGHVYIAPSGKHMAVEWRGGNYHCRIFKGEPVSRHCPSVDVLFRSVADNVGASAIGVILTGMGADGAAGLKEIRDNGGRTIGQDEKSCIVYGMPRVAFEVGGVATQLSLKDIPHTLHSYCS